MLFVLLKYLQPTHYFQLFTHSGKSVFPIIEELPSAVLDILEYDTRFQSSIAINYDLSWQAIQSGYIGNVATYTTFESISLYDNYLFLRKYFHPAWIIYVLLIRICSLYNPINELKAWFKTKHVARRSIKMNSLVYHGWKENGMRLLKQNPKVSVIIPTLNRYPHLKMVLSDLEQQDYGNFEVIVVDQSEPFNKSFYDNFNLEIQLVRQLDKALWLARNTAIKMSNGELIALSEDDVRIKPDWISTHLKCLDFFKVKVSAGVFYPDGQQIPLERSFFALASQFATGNAMLYKSVFKKVGLFDRQFEKQRMGDGEFGLRLYLADIRSISNPFASCIDVKAGTGGLREMGSWDAFRPSHFFKARPIPSVLYYFRRYYGNQAARWALLRTVPISVMPYQFKRNKPMLIFGIFMTIVVLPFVFFQVFKSWSLASKKIKEGSKIDILE